MKSDQLIVMRIVSVLSLLCLVDYCHASLPQSDLSSYVKSEMYFGLSYVCNVTDTCYVTDEEFSAFITNVVTPLFPSGLTVLRADGQWQSDADPSIVIEEPSRYMIIYHPDDLTNNNNIKIIVDQYMIEFNQEAVLYATIQADTCLTSTECLSHTQRFEAGRTADLALWLGIINTIIIILVACIGMYFYISNKKHNMDTDHYSTVQ